MALHLHRLCMGLKRSCCTVHRVALSEISLGIRACALRLHHAGSTALCHAESKADKLVNKQTTRRRENESKGGRKRNEYFSYSFLFMPAIFKGESDSGTSDELSPEEKLVYHIKRSILLIQNGEPEKAEQLLHITLKMAQDLKHEKGITYIYDTLANLAFENGEYVKAQKIFVEVLRRLIGSGLPQDDIAVVNISLKIADGFAAMSDYQKAEQGFLFCLETLRKKIAGGATDEDTLMLYSQSLDRYGLFLLLINKPVEALKCLENAIETAKSVLGDINNKIGAILLSDMGAIKTASGDKDGGNTCFDEALKIAGQDEVDASVAVIMVNRGTALKDGGFFEEARHWCNLGRNEATKENDKAALKLSEACLQAINQNVKKSPNGTSYLHV